MAFGRGASSASTGNTGHESSCHPKSDCGDLLGLETHILEIERTNMTFPVILFVCAAILVALNSDRGLSQDSSGKSFYLIGNSLTWDTVPQQLDGDTQWHVDCGVSLPYIHANPAKPCVKQSTIWPKALRDKQYDVVSVQPHSGSTLSQDVETISDWMKLQQSPKTPTKTTLSRLEIAKKADGIIATTQQEN